MLRAIERGLTLSNFEDLTIGMIMDYVITYNNEHLTDDEKEDQQADQTDFDKF